MKNNTIDVTFSTSNKATDLCLTRAKYITNALGEDLTKANINKHYKRCLKEYRESFSINTKQEVGFLHCTKTNAEIGFYLKTSYQGWDSLSILYVNPDFRGEGHSRTLINLYDMDCKDVSVIELSPEHFEETKSLYSYAGYTETLGGLFPTSIGLIKKDTIEALSKAVDADSVTYTSIYEKLVKITKDCKTKLDLVDKLEQIREEFKIFKNEDQLIDFCRDSLLPTSYKNPLLDSFIRDYLKSFTNPIAA